MSIVPAGVHKPRRNGRMVGPARLFDRQGVHVRAKERALSPGLRRSRGAMEDAKDAGFGDAFDDLVESEGPQAVGDDAGGARQVVEELRISVEIAPPFGQLRRYGGDRIVEGDGHRDAPYANCCGVPRPSAPKSQRLAEVSIANRPTNLKGRLARYTPVHDVDRALRIACELIVMGHHDHGPSFVGESPERSEER